MPRNSGYRYTLPPNTLATPQTTIESARFNAFANDVAETFNGDIGGVAHMLFRAYNPMESRFGGTGDGVANDRAAVRAAAQALVDNGGGTLVLTRPHRITGGVLFTENVPIRITFLGAGALICAFDEPDVAFDFNLVWNSYNTPAPIIQDARIRLAGTAPDSTCRGLRIRYTSEGGGFGGGTGGPRIIRPRIRPTVGSRTWLHPIELTQAPHAMVFDPAIIGRGGKNAADRQGAGIALGSWSQGFMCLEGNIRGYAAGVRVSDQIDYDGDAADFQAEGGTLNEVKIQSCDIAFDIDVADTEVAWRLINCNATANTFLRSRNIADWLVQGNSIQWGRRNTHQVDIILQRDDGDVNAPNDKILRALVQGNSTKTAGDVNFDVTDIARGASTVITYSNLATAVRTITAIAIDPDDGGVTVTYSGTVGQGRNGRMIEISGATTPSELNGQWRMGELDSVAGTFRLYQPDSAVSPESLVDGSDWSPSLTGTPIFERYYSSGVIADGDVMWLDQITGTTALDRIPVIVADHDATAKTFTAKRYPGGEDIDTTGQPALAAIGRVSRHGCFIEVRGGRDVDISDNMIHARSLAVHAWPMARGIVVNDNKLNNTGSYNPRLLINESEDPATITVFGPDVQEDGLALQHYGGITHFIRTVGSPGDGIRSDAPWWNDMLAAGKSVIVADASRKRYLIDQPVLITVDGTGIICPSGKADIRMSTAAGHFDNNVYVNRYSISDVGAKFAVGFHALGRAGAFLENLKIRPDAWTDLRYLKPVLFDGCASPKAMGLDVSLFSRTRGLITIRDCTDIEVVWNHLHTCWSNSTSGTGSELQITGIEVDDNRTTGTRRGRIAHNDIHDLTIGYAAVVALGYQSDGINLNGRAPKTTAPELEADTSSQDIEIVSNTIVNTGDAIDVFGTKNLIARNMIRRAFNTGIKLAHGASYNVVDQNVITDVGLCGVLTGGGTAAPRSNVMNNVISGNTIRNIDITGDWQNADGGLSWDYAAAGNVTRWATSKTAGVRITGAADATNFVDGIRIIGNMIDGGGTGDNGVFMEGFAGSPRNQFMQGNVIVNVTGKPLDDTQGYFTVGDTPMRLVQIAAHTLENTTSPQPAFNVPSDAGASNAKAGQRYRWRAQVMMSSLSSSSAAFQFGFGGTATYTRVSFTTLAKKSGGVGGLSMREFTSVTPADVVSANTSTAGQIVAEGMFVVNAAGTIVPQVALNAATASATVNAGSYFEIWEDIAPTAVNGDFA